MVAINWMVGETETMKPHFFPVFLARSLVPIYPRNPNTW